MCLTLFCACTTFCEWTNRTVIHVSRFLLLCVFFFFKLFNVHDSDVPVFVWSIPSLCHSLNLYIDHFCIFMSLSVPLYVLV
jgi:hypothetical protein